MIIIVCICHFKFIIRCRLPKYSTLRCIIREERIIIWLYFSCINDCVSYFCPRCLPVSQFLDKISAISLNRLTTIRVLARSKNSRPVGFLL
jgi:hypothetical protein